MKKHLLIFFLMLGCAGQPLLAQNRTVTGKVTDESTGEALPGVNILVKGTQLGTASDTEGTFKLEVPTGSATLVLSFIGFATIEVPVGNARNIDVAMQPDSRQLSEVVVTALGVERTRNSLPYAATQIDGTSVTAGRNPNMINSLAGKVAGLNITQTNTLGGSANVVIRGTKSLTGNNQALFVIDGVPVNNDVSNTRSQSQGNGGYDYGNPAADINPDDIASVSVLKGAASTALYGSRASNGVILITTKKGRKGLGVTINTGVTVGKVDKKTLPVYQKEYGGGYVEKWALFDVDGDGKKDNVVRLSDDASYGFKFDPNIQVYQWDAFDPASPNYRKARPWVAAEHGPEYFFEKSVSTNNSIMVDGGNEKAAFKLGFTRSTDKGIVPNSHINKNMVSFGGTLHLTPKLQTQANVNFTQQEGLGRYGSGYSSSNNMLGFRQWFQTNVDIKEQKEAYFRQRKNISWNWSSPSELVAAYSDNAYFTRYENFENDERYRTFGNVAAIYDLATWLKITGRVSLDSYDELQEERYAVGSTTNDGDPSYSRYNRTFREFNFDLFANFNRNITKELSLNGLLGLNMRRSKQNSLDASTSGGLVVPRLYSLSNSKSLLSPPIESERNIAVDGVFASATLGFRETVFLDLSARRDQSSTLPKANNAYFYPSAAASFVFSEMLKNVPWLSYGKLRGNYAEVGSDAPFAATGKYYNKQDEEIGRPVGGFNGIPLYSVPNTRYNPTLKPERTKSSEFGLEMAFLSNRLGFDFTTYKARTLNQILPVTVPTTTGYSYKYVNAGEVANKGLELTLFVTPVKTESFSWTINANWSRNRNKVVALAEGENMILATYQTSVTSNAAIGRPFGILRGSGYVLHENGKRIIDEDGQYLKSSPTKEIGDPNPQWIGGLSNTFSYKGLSLYFLVDVKKGGQLYNLDTYYGFGTGLYPETAGLNELGNPSRLPVAQGGGILLDGVKEDGSPNDVRLENTESSLGSNGPNESHIYGAGFVKLREASLSYALPASVISKLKVFKGIDLSLVGRNLWIMQKDVPYSDPEAGFGAGNLGMGYLGGAYPSARNIGFNIKFRF
ncbi:SusC/RagA family TonB-linked outer membrane protein [Dyadobacter sp. CY326]|uniref:SusC/RagA family TonB-linked outer membrane protein n=1 Tax=Dyadobacter sp. CY326 TaxID=2907300 RepID=UPI001F31F583|nr:SusC/RagA family TonB-linked outer membrane protein [Dyadobacter sp. CY326]MCE7064981.1 SusC/RagA family TonB-linked outer membrane protein [Dyadobacter sp. CY326]